MDIERINQIFDEIGTFNIDLSHDPTVLGPQYLAKLISTCRNYLNRTATILLSISREKVTTENNLEAERSAYKIAFDEMLSTDERIMKLPNIRDREAMINTQLTDRTQRITTLEQAVRNLNSIEKAVKVRHNELIRTDSQIKTQRSLIRDEIDTKSYMGDEHTSRSRRGTIDEDELNELMDDVPVVREADAPQGNSKEIFTLPESELPKSIEETLAEASTLKAPFVEALVAEALPAETVVSAQAPTPSEPPAPAEPIADALAIVADLEAQEAKAVPEEAAAAPEEAVSAPEATPNAPGGTDMDAIMGFLNDGPSTSTTGTASKKTKKDKAPAKTTTVVDSDLLVAEKSTIDSDSDFEDILKNL